MWKALQHSAPCSVWLLPRPPPQQLRKTLLQQTSWPSSLACLASVPLNRRIKWDSKPLSNCNEETKSWLPDLVHKRWLLRWRVESLVAEAEQAVETAQNAYELLRAKLKSISCVTSVKFLLGLKPEFQAFYEACDALGKAIEKFPSTVKVIQIWN